jgi:tetratricopeptide (TPR) repeat protein
MTLIASNPVDLADAKVVDGDLSAWRAICAAKSAGIGLRRWATLALPALGLALALSTSAAEPPARDQALSDLKAASSVVRLDAVKRLGDVGLASDADALLARLADDDMQVRAAAAEAVWRAWGRTGDLAVDAQYKRGVQQMTAGDVDEAIATFSLLVRNKPDFAEAWNKRATAFYLRGDFRRALKDCDQVFKLNPRHFGALAGASQIHARLGQPEQALVLFKRALAVNPNMDDAAEMIRILQLQIDAKRDDMI